MSSDSELKRLERANPVTDLEESLKKGDRRFIGIGGLGLKIPNVPNPEKYEKMYGIRVIDVESVSPGTRIEEHIKLAEIAAKYAGEYNRLLLKHLNEQQSKQ